MQFFFIRSIALFGGNTKEYQTIKATTTPNGDALHGILYTLNNLKDDFFECYPFDILSPVFFSLNFYVNSSLFLSLLFFFLRFHFGKIINYSFWYDCLIYSFVVSLYRSSPRVHSFSLRCLCFIFASVIFAGFSTSSQCHRARKHILDAVGDGVRIDGWEWKRCVEKEK